MSRRRSYTVACLAGHGIGPEVMAQASRALAEVSRLHGFRIEERHAPFAGEALARFGHPLPSVTRAAYLRADAILVAGAAQPALAGVHADLDLVAGMTRMLGETGDLTIFAPLADGAEDWTIERAFATALARRGRLVSVGVNGAWRTRVELAAQAHDGVAVRHLTLAEALPLLHDAPHQVDVLVTERVLAEALPQVPRLSPSGRRVAATGLLSPTGPSLFGPTHGAALNIAGQGVANPSETLLAASLLLGEGLGRRSAEDTLARSVAGAVGRDRAAVGRTTRELGDLVLALLDNARRDTEFVLEGAL
jgi:3-isopropylmalate dehydrogenase